MSLINDMLRDLEARRGPTVTPEERALEGLTPVNVWPHTATRTLPWVVFTAICAVAAAFSLERLQAVRHVPRDAGEVRRLEAPRVPPIPTTPRADAGDVPIPHARNAEPPVVQPRPAAEDLLSAQRLPVPEPAPVAASGPGSDPVTEELRAQARAIEAGDSPRDRHAADPIDPAPAPAAAAPASRSLAAPAAPDVERPGTFRREAARPRRQAAGDVALSRALNQLRGGDRARGIATLADYLRGNPGHVAARIVYARELIRDARHGEAESVLRAGLEAAPRSIALARLLAHLLFEQKRAAAALQVLRRAAPPVAVDPEYHVFMAAVYQQMNSHVEAVTTYRAVLEVRPASGSAALGMAISLAALGRAQEAGIAFARAAADPALSGAVREYAASEAGRLGGAR